MTAVSLAQSMLIAEGLPDAPAAHLPRTPGSSRRPLMQARDDQVRLAAHVRSILRESDHAFLESPTGSGKTLTMALIGEAWTKRTKVYLAHSIDIIDQTARQMDHYAAAGVIADRSSWRCLTWHAYREAVRRDRLAVLLGTASPPLVLVDECHIGGADGREGNLSYQAIRETARKVVWISATPWDINESVLGPREGRSAVLGMQEAFGLGLLNSTDIVRIDCGLKLRAAVAHFEKLTGAAFSSLAAQSVYVDKNCAEEAHDDLSEQVRALLDRPLRPSDVSTIVRHRIRLLADVYLQRHMSERAMFWLPNQSYAKECAQYISDRLPCGERAEAIVHDPGNSTAEAEYAIQAREEFSREAGSVRVACVVFRLREGFDSPGLRLGFDCSWSPRNLRGTVQKIGRLTRRAPGKPRSQYYYAVDVKTVAGARSRQMSEVFLGGVQAALRSDVPSAQFTAEAIIEAGAIAGAMSGNGDFIPRRFLSQRDWLGTTMTCAHVPLFEFDDVTGYAEVSRATLDAAFVKSEEALNPAAAMDIANRLLEALEDGSAPEDLPQVVRNALRRCTVQFDDLYDPLMLRRLNRAAPQLAMEWNCLLRPSVLERMDHEDAIVAAIEAGEPRPHLSTLAGERLSRALSRTQPQFRPDLAARMAAIGMYEPKAERNARLMRETDEHIERIIGAIESGAEPPKQGTVDRRKLDGWLSPFGRKTRSDVRERIAKVRPSLLPKGISYAERDTTRRAKQDELVAWIAEHQRLPPCQSKIGRWLQCWTRNKPSFLGDFLTELEHVAQCDTLHRALSNLKKHKAKKRKGSGRRQLRSRRSQA